MILKQFEGMQWLEFELLQDFPFIHGCFKRFGGYSSGFLESLNFSRSVGDNPDCVNKNFAKAAQALSCDEIFSAKLCHGADIFVATHDNKNSLPVSDALITKSPGLAIAVTQADCQAAIFYDPINHALANVHCGWRGNVQNIYEATIKTMASTYGSKPADLFVCISPSLGPDQSEFINYRTELPESFWSFESKKLHFNLWEISRWQLITSGVLENHIQIAEVDTYANDEYFSYRRSVHQKMPQCGRQATICALV